MAHVCNISPSHRPSRPSLDRGPVQRRARRAFLASGMEMLSTPQIAEWTHPRGTNRWNAHRYLRDVLKRYCIRAARGSGVGRPLLWKLRAFDARVVTMRDLRLMGLLRLAPAAIQQRFGRGHAGSIRRMGFIHDRSERLDFRSPRRRKRAAWPARRPSAFAVLRLITNSYLVGACTGRSAGFSPLRMRST